MSTLPQIKGLIEQLESCLKVSNTKKSLKILEQIVKSPSCVIDQLEEIDTLIHISCFLLKHSLFQVKTYRITKNQNVERMENCLRLLINKVSEEKRPEALNAIISYCHESNSWHLEYISARMFQIFCSSENNSELILTGFIDYIAELLESGSFEEASEVASVLQQTIGTEKVCQDIINYNDVNRILCLYHSLVTAENKNDFIVMISSLELCLKRLLNSMSGPDLLQIVINSIMMTLDAVSSVCLEFENLTITVVRIYLHKENIFDVPTFLLDYLIEGVVSHVPSKSCFACKVLARFFDNQNNYNEFMYPKIFYYYMSYDISPSLIKEKKELELVQSYKSLICDSLLKALKQHVSIKKNLNAIYTTICTIIVKVLPGTQIPTVVCLIMDVQDYLLEASVMNMVKNYGHGLVLSLMTLYCWIYRQKPLLNYVEVLINKRFAEAQHLLPVMKGYEVTFKSYQTNRKDLFFDNLELRYALWKCYVSHAHKAKKKH